MERTKVFAPASVANIGPGFDIMGFAVDGIGDTVIARHVAEPGVFIKRITGANGVLPSNPAKNTASIAAASVMKTLGITDGGLQLELEKGLPLNSGLGSSGASAVAGAFAALNVFAEGRDKRSIILDCLEAETAVSGPHADNVASSLLGGFIVIKSYEPLDVLRLPVPDSLCVAIVTPECHVSTRAAREMLPREVPLKSLVKNTGNVASLVYGIMQNDISIIGKSIDDCIVEPVRATLIPGFEDVKRAALEAGALGCSISGSGPSVFAFTPSISEGKPIVEAMKGAFERKGLASTSLVSGINRTGAVVV